MSKENKAKKEISGITNLDIWSSAGPLQVICNQKFPVMVSYKLAKLAQKLNEARKPIEEAKNILVKKHGEEDDKTKQLAIKPDSANWESFSKEFNELMEIASDLKIEKIKLPEKTASTCDKCHHNMDRPFEIEPVILLALDKFIEIT